MARFDRICWDNASGLHYLGMDSGKISWALVDDVLICVSDALFIILNNGHSIGWTGKPEMDKERFQPC